jgi:acyl-CoA synthetase (AMP-forming)/AMP-acid ligase II
MITRRIYEWAHSQPAKLAVTFNDESFSYGDFARAIERARGFFARQGFQAGQTAIIFPSNFDAWVFMLALRALGLNTVCIQTADQLEGLTRIDAAGIIVPEGTTELPLKGTTLHHTRTIIVPSAIFMNIRWGEQPVYPEHAHPFGSHILMTSGTTGAYKKLYLDGRYEDARNAARANVYPLSQNMTFRVGNLGLWTGVGFKLPSAVWHTGGTVIIDQRQQTAKTFFDYPIDLAIVTPALLRELVRSRREGPRHDGCELLVAAGFLPLGLAQEAVRHLTTRLGIAYGSTELATPALLSRRGAEPDMYWLTPTANRSIRIVDEDGNECAPGQEGELRVQLMDIDCKSYLDDEEASARMFESGFFRPGDLAVGRADGQIRILGRIADVLNLGGRKVAVAPLEMTVQRMLKVDEVCLFSGLSEVGTEDLVIAVETDRALPKAELDQVAREFPSFGRIRFALFKEFPRTTAGMRKTRRSVLRKLVFPQA